MRSAKSVTICSYRLGGRDGVSIEAAKWADALRELGCTVRTVAGSGPVDVVLPGLEAYTTEPPPTKAALEEAFAEADLVIVENLCSLPLNLRASQAVADVLAGRPALLHHHDLASQRPALAHLGPPPDDPAWIHVCVNDITRRELAALDYAAITCYNAFDPRPNLGDRESTRDRLELIESDRLVLQPTRAIGRKNVPGGIALAEALGATYWLTGAAEDGYDHELADCLARARVPVRHDPDGPASIADAYAACDLVVLPSTWEGFGNPSIEAATFKRPLAIGDYPVANELKAFGFRWFDASDPAPIAKFLAAPDTGLLEENASIAQRHFSLDDLPKHLSDLLAAMPGTLRSG